MSDHPPLKLWDSVQRGGDGPIGLVVVADSELVIIAWPQTDCGWTYYETIRLTT